MFKILNKKTENKSGFAVANSSKSLSKNNIKLSREWRNIEILAEVVKGDYSNAKDYSGFGGMYNQLQDKEVQKSLSELLSVDEWESLRKSTSTAYYTPKKVIEYCWQIVEQLGFKSGEILEPCCGTGAFFESMPDLMRLNSQITAIELEQVSAHIASALYDDIEVINEGYQNHKGEYDLIITNPPYATFPVKDRYYSELNELKIHHAFLARSMRLLRNGGLCVMVVPCYCLDSATNHARDIIAKDAELICSYRLPDSLFSDAKVTTDIVVFQKKEKPNNQHLGLTKIELNCGYKDVISDYYIENENHILGELQKYEIWLPKEKRHRRGLKVSATIDEVNKRLPDLIAGLEPVYKQDVVLKVLSDGLVQRASENKLSMPAKVKNDTVEVDKILSEVAQVGYNLEMLNEEIEEEKRNLANIQMRLAEFSHEILVLAKEIKPNKAA
jgi:type I restriction-modification system DNA methylase subunit